jgi:hypothetical protein
MYKAGDWWCAAQSWLFDEQSIAYRTTPNCQSATYGSNTTVAYTDEARLPENVAGSTRMTAQSGITTKAAAAFSRYDSFADAA